MWNLQQLWLLVGYIIITSVRLILNHMWLIYMNQLYYQGGKIIFVDIVYVSSHFEKKMKSHRWRFKVVIVNEDFCWLLWIWEKSLLLKVFKKLTCEYIGSQLGWESQPNIPLLIDKINMHCCIFIYFS